MFHYTYILVPVYLCVFVCVYAELYGRTVFLLSGPVTWARHVGILWNPCLSCITFVLSSRCHNLTIPKYFSILVSNHFPPPSVPSFLSTASPSFFFTHKYQGRLLFSMAWPMCPLTQFCQLWKTGLIFQPKWLPLDDIFLDLPASPQLTTKGKFMTFISELLVY